MDFKREYKVVEMLGNVNSPLLKTCRGLFVPCVSYPFNTPRRRFMGSSALQQHSRWITAAAEWRERGTPLFCYTPYKSWGTLESCMTGSWRGEESGLSAVQWRASCCGKQLMSRVTCRSGFRTNSLKQSSVQFIMGGRVAYIHMHKQSGSVWRRESSLPPAGLPECLAATCVDFMSNFIFILWCFHQSAG